MAGIWAVVPAAGRGSRFGGDIPKQYLVAAGKPLIEHALDALLAHPGIEGVVVALADGDHGDREDAVVDQVNEPKARRPRGCGRFGEIATCNHSRVNV